MDQENKKTFPSVCNNLAQKFHDQPFPGRSDVRVNGNAANSSVLVIVNFFWKQLPIKVKSSFLLNEEVSAKC